MDDLSFDYSDDDLAIPHLGRGAMDDPEPETATASEATPPETDVPVADPEEGGERPSVCVAFRGVGGGVGTTSLAITTAHLFAQAKRGEVCLVDLDFALGMCGHYLDMGVTPDVRDFQADPLRVDANFVRAMLGHHEAGFSVLASPGISGGNEIVNPATVLKILDVIADMYPVVVLDVPRLLRPWTEAALMAADRVALVTELNIPALHVTRQRLSELETMGVMQTDVVLSKYERRTFRATLRQTDAERAIGCKAAANITLDAITVSEAMNCGVPTTVAAPDSRYAKDAWALACHLSPHFAERRRKRR